MVEMHVEGLSLDPQTRKPIVILRQNDGKGLLPLWIGAMEAMTISLVLNGEELPRPLAHDLLLMVAKALNGTLTGVDSNTKMSTPSSSSSSMMALETPGCEVCRALAASVKFRLRRTASCTKRN